MAAQNKAKSHSLLGSLGLRVPDEISFHSYASDQSIKEMVSKIGFPCVIKPSDTDGGKGVTANIQNLKN